METETDGTERACRELGAQRRGKPVRVPAGSARRVADELGGNQLREGAQAGGNGGRS